MNESQFKRIDLAAMAETPTEDGTYELKADRWWSVDKDGNGLVFMKHSYQCNKHENLVWHINGCKDHPGVDVVFYPRIWTPA